MIDPPEGAGGADWAWRVDLAGPPDTLWPGRAVESGADVAPGVRLFHDGGGAAGRLAPGLNGLTLWAAGGGYASLAIALPAAGIAALGPRHVLRVAGRARLSGDAPLHGRITLRHGPDLARQSAPVTLADGRLGFGFDLAYLAFEAEIAHGWIDLILERPGDAALTLTELHIHHAPRLEP